MSGMYVERRAGGVGKRTRGDNKRVATIGVHHFVSDVLQFGSLRPLPKTDLVKNGTDMG